MIIASGVLSPGDQKSSPAENIVSLPSSSDERCIREPPRRSMRRRGGLVDSLRLIRMMLIDHRQGSGDEFAKVPILEVPHAPP
jgi:hypothetical protein